MDWKNVDTTHCGIKACTSILGDKWTLLILRDIYFGVTKFQDLQQHIGASSTIITQRLKKLVAYGLLSKSEYKQQGSRVHNEYILTEKGATTLPLLIAMAQFGYEHLIESDQKLSSFIDANTGETLNLALVNDKGQAVPREQVKVVINAELS